MRIAFLFTHPVQYLTPLVSEISKETNFNIKVYYCEDTTKGYYDKEFGKVLKWDIPLLEGYKYDFLPNSRLKKIGGFFRYANFSIIRKLRTDKPDVLIIHGWNYLTALIAIITCKFLSIKIWHRGDNPYRQEMLKPKTLLFIKKVILGYVLFSTIDRFLYVGLQNKLFYKFYAVPEIKLLSSPHAINNSFFQKIRQSLPDKLQLRNQLKLDPEIKVVLVVGKLTKNKNADALLDAFKILNREDVMLVFVGDGENRTLIDNFKFRNKFENIIITGFKNQGELPAYYAMADVFVLPSKSETWGLVVNEAMNFELPIICSESVGCADDLIKHGINGFKIDLNKPQTLVQALNQLLDDPELRVQMGKASLEIVQKYSYQEAIHNIKKELEIA